jgi:hypothetical protein
MNGILPAIAVIIFWMYRQATPGKMLIGAKIVDAKTLGKPTTGQLIGRYFSYYLSTIGLLLGSSGSVGTPASRAGTTSWLAPSSSSPDKVVEGARPLQGEVGTPKTLDELLEDDERERP